MKIKRYESVGGTKIQSNRSLSTGTAGSNAIAQIGTQAISSVLQYGASQNALTAKLRRLEITAFSLVVINKCKHDIIKQCIITLE